MHELVARCVRVVDDSGLPYQVTPMATVVQGSVDELLDLARRMMEAARGEGDVPRLLLTVRIDESREMEHSLDDRVKIVEQTLDSSGGP